MQRLLPLYRLIAKLPRGGYRIVRRLARGDVLLPTEVGPMWCDLRESICYPLLKDGTYRYCQDDTHWLRAAVGPSDLVFDVGANIGFTARLFAQSGAKVIAFEPSPKAFRLLARNLAGIGDARQLAVADRPGRLFFEECAQLNLSHLADRGIEVEAVTIDSLPERPTFIKIDVEGFEASVLAGATETLRQGPTIFFEALDAAALAESSRIIREANPAYEIEPVTIVNYVARVAASASTIAPASVSTS
jgi:FkbM family methyltransferase